MSMNSKGMRKMIRRLFIVAAMLLMGAPAYGATTLLPNGMQCFSNADGPLSGGSVYMYVPSTTTFKQTWQDSSQSTLNSQPIVLDANGCALIYGVGSYRQQVYTGPDNTSTLVWDQITTDTSAYNSVFWAGNAGGTPNVITVTYTGFNGTDGSIIQFIPIATNTGAATLNPSGFGAVPILKDTASGAVALSGGEIVFNAGTSNVVSVVYSASQNAFHLLNLISAAASASPPLCGAVGLSVTNDTSFPNSLITITADQVVMQTTTGEWITRNNVSTSVNYTTNGAGGLDTGTFSASTWYNHWIIDNGISTSAIGSTSATAPTMPSGYSYKCRLGAMRTDGATALFRFQQSGAWTQYKVTAGTNTAAVPTIFSGVTAGTCAAGGMTSFTVKGGGTNVLPPTATMIDVQATNVFNGGATSLVCAGPNNAVADATSANPSPVNLSSGARASMMGMFKLEGNAIFGVSSQAGGFVGALGWKDSINAN